MSLKCKKLKNKGMIFDMVTLISLIFVAVLSLILAGTVVSLFFQEFNNLDISDNEYSGLINETQEKTEQGFATFDLLFFPIAIVGMIIGLIFTSFLIPSHPIFVVINVIGMIFIVILCLVLQSAYQSLIDMAEVSSGVSYIVYLHYVMQSLPWIAVITITIATIIGYSKRGDGLY